MNETKLATSIHARTNAPEAGFADDGKTSEIRLLDELELVLASGGEGEVNWP